MSNQDKEFSKEQTIGLLSLEVIRTMNKWIEKNLPDGYGPVEMGAEIIVKASARASANLIGNAPPEFGVHRLREMFLKKFEEILQKRIKENQDRERDQDTTIN